MSDSPHGEYTVGSYERTTDDPASFAATATEAASLSVDDIHTQMQLFPKAGDN